MIHTGLKLATAAGLLGLVVLHPDAFARIIRSATGLFRAAVTIT